MRRLQRSPISALAALTALAAILRAWGLGSVFPVEDEYFQFFEALQPQTASDFLRLIRHNPHHALIDPLTTWLAARLGDSAAWLRTPSFLWGVLAVPALWSLGSFGGLGMAPRVAAGLLGVSLLHADWSRRADFYSLLVLLSILHAGALLRLLARPKSWPLYAFLGAVFLHSHPYALPTAILHLAFVGWAGGRDAGLAVRKAWAWAGLAYLPWFAFSASGLAAAAFDFSGVPGLPGAAEFLFRAPLALGQAPEAGPGRAWSWDLGTPLSLLYLGGYAYSLTALGSHRDPLLRLSHGMILAGTGAVTALNLGMGYYFSPRQLLWVAPFYLIAAADGALRSLDLLKPSPRTLRVGLGIGLIAILSLHRRAVGFQLDMAGRHQAILGTVEAALEPGDILGFRSQGLLSGFLFYYDRDAFRRLAGLSFQGEPGGRLRLVVPPDLRARRGAKDHAVMLIEGAAAAPPERLWLFDGTLYDMRVYPPEGRSFPMGRPASQSTPAALPRWLDLALSPLSALSHSPSLNRNWAPELSVLPRAAITADNATVRGVRDFRWRSETDWEPAYDVRSYDLRTVDSVWFMVEPFSRLPGPAHALLSFGFSDGRYLAISAEIRKIHGETFSPFKGLWRNYELVYIVGDEADLLGLRANHRRHEVFLYPIRAAPEAARAMLVDMLARANALGERPEFYNSLTNTCLSNIIGHLRRIAPSLAPAWDWRILLPAYSDRLAYDRGLIATDLPFAEARRRFQINDRAAGRDRDPDFSRLIRKAR